MKCNRFHRRPLHLSLAFRTPLVLVLVLLADELVRLLVCLLLHHRVAELSVFSLQLVTGQVFHDTGADGVSQDIGRGT